MVNLVNVCTMAVDLASNVFVKTVGFVWQSVKCITLNIPKYLKQECLYKRVAELEKKVWKLENKHD